MKKYKVYFNQIVKGRSIYSREVKFPKEEVVEAYTFKEARQKIRNKYGNTIKNIITEELEWN